MTADAPLPPGVLPLFLTLSQAAAYAGVGEDVFRDEVAAGLWPKPIARGAKGGKPTWHREQMEAAARALAGAVPAAAPPAPATSDQPEGAAPALSGRATAAVERIRRAQGTVRPERRHPKAA